MCTPQVGSRIDWILLSSVENLRLAYTASPTKTLDRSFNYIISPEISEFRKFSPKLKIGVLASGKGTNLQELINLSENDETNAKDTSLNSDDDLW